MKYASLILVAALLAGCVRLSSLEPSGVAEPGAAPALASPTAMATPEPGASPTPILPTLTPPAAAGLTQTPAVTETLSSASAQTLLDFPLAAGNTWVYRFDGHTGTQTAAWKVSDTVVQVETHGRYYAAKIQREVALIEGAPGADFINPPLAQTFWYVVAERAVYRLDDPIDWTAVSAGVLELLFPFPNSTCWYPDPTQRAQSPAAGLPGCRTASGPAAVDTPAGRFDNCFQVITTENGGSEILTFCRGLGIAASEYQHAGTDFGSRMALTGYLLQ